MTLKELNNLRGIESEISMILKNIDELRTQAEHITPNITTYTHTDCRGRGYTTPSTYEAAN